jgi:hypothetical protein
MQDQPTISSSVLPACAQQRPSRRQHHWRTPQTEHVLLTIPPPPPPLPELGQLRVQKPLDQVLAATDAATVPRRRRACARPNEGIWKCEKVLKGRE